MIVVPKVARRAFKRDFLAMIAAGMMSGGIGPYLAFVASHRLHASATLISLMVCAPWIGNSLSLFWANAAEGKSKMRFVRASWLVARSIFILMLFANTTYAFALVAMAGQFLGTVATPAYASILRAIYPREHRGRLMGYVRVASAISATVSTSFVGPILNRWDGSYRMVFPAAALFGLISAFIFGGIEVPKDDESESNGGERMSLAQFLRSSFSIFREDRGYAWFVFSLSVYGFGNFLSTPAYPKFQDEFLKMNEANLAIMAVLANVSVMLAYLFWGHYIDRRGPIKATALTILINAGLPLTYCLAPSFVWILPAAVFTSIVNSGCELSYFNTVLRFSKPGQETRYQGLQSCAQGLRGTFGPLMGGIAYDVLRSHGWDVRYLFIASIILILTGWRLQVYGLRRVYPELAG